VTSDRADPDDPLLGPAQVAARLGIAEVTWRSYVSREQAPPADDPGDPAESKFRRRPRWLTSTIDAFAGRPFRPGRRTDLAAARQAARDQAAADLAAPAALPTPTMSRWLEQNHAAVFEVAEALVDHRELLLAVAPRLDALAEAIDAAGMQLSGRPSRALASAVAYALGLLPAEALARLPDHSDAQVVLEGARQLREEFNRLRG
jgi:hypothetical protein